jgi:hypothetical protein
VAVAARALANSDDVFFPREERRSVAKTLALSLSARFVAASRRNTGRMLAPYSSDHISKNKELVN